MILLSSASMFTLEFARDLMRRSARSPVLAAWLLLHACTTPPDDQRQQADALDAAETTDSLVIATDAAADGGDDAAPQRTPQIEIPVVTGWQQPGNSYGGTPIGTNLVVLPEPDLHIAVHLNGAAGGGSELVTLTRDGSTWIVLRAASPWTENPDKMAVRSAPGRWHVYARAWYIRATITDSMKFEDLGDLGVIDPTVHWELFDVAARSSGGVIHLAATAKDNTTIVRHPDLMVTSATDTVVGRWHATDVITSGGGGAVTELSDGSVVAAFSALGENAGSPLRLWLAHATADAKPIAERYPDVGDAGFVQDLVSIGDGDAILAWTEQQAGGSDNWMTTGRLTRIDAKLQVVWTQKLTSPYQGLPQRLRLAGSTLFLTGPAGWVSDTLLTRAFGLDGELLFAQTLVPAPNWDVGGDLYVPKSGPLQLVMIAKELQLWPLPSGL